MQVRKRQAFDELAALLEIRGGLARESHHDVRADRRVTHQQPRFLDPVGIMPRAILAVHPAQDPIAAALQRRMHVAGDPRRLRHQPEQVVREIHRLDGAQPETLDFRLREQNANQAGESQPASGLPAPSPQVDAAEHDLAIPPRQSPHLFDHLLHRRAPAAPADERNDAKRAAIIATVLDFQIRAGAIAGRVLHRRGKKVVLREDISDVDIPVIRRALRAERHQVRDLGFVRIADHPLHPGQRREFRRRPLRIAAGDQDPRRWILAVDAADGLPHVVIGRRSDGAGVQDHEVGGGPLPGRVEALGRQQRFQRRPVGLRRPAAEILNEVLPHFVYYPPAGAWSQNGRPPLV